MFEMFATWFSALPVMSQVYWCCAVAGSLIFLIQLVLTLLGMDASDIDVDFDGPDTMDLGGGMSLFTVRALVNFLVGFGWSGVCFGKVVDSAALTVAIAVATGLLFSWVILFLYSKMKRLEYNAAFAISDCVGQTGTVYLRIPAARSGMGKVQVSVRGSVHEVAACTDGGQIASGTLVRVVEAINADCLLVVPAAQ